MTREKLIKADEYIIANVGCIVVSGRSFPKMREELIDFFIKLRDELIDIECDTQKKEIIEIESIIKPNASGGIVLGKLNKYTNENKL